MLNTLSCFKILMACVVVIMSMAVEINLRHIYYVPNYSEEDYISKVTVSATGALNFKRL